MAFANRTIWSVYHTNDISLTEDGVIAVRRREIGDLSEAGGDKAALRARFEDAFPEETGLDKTVAVSLLHRFACEMRSGDLVVYRSYRDAEVRLGVITGDYVYDEAQEYAHRRSVSWRKTLPQSAFSAPALREIGYSSPAPLFPVKCHAQEFFAALGISAPVSAPVRTVSARPQDTSTELCDFVLDALGRSNVFRGLKEFTAGLLQAMGYRVTLLASARDDIDIIAHRDELMPRMLVKVADGDAGVGDVEALRRAQKRGDYGLLLTLGTFSDEVRAALDAAYLRGVDGTELAGLTLAYYGSLHERYRKLIPLKSIYVPVA